MADEPAIIFAVTDPTLNVSITNTASGVVQSTVDAIVITSSPPGLVSTGAFIIDNAGIIKSTVSGRAIVFDLSVSSPGTITIINTGLIAAVAGEAIVMTGASADTIINKGMIEGSVSTAGGDDTFNLFTGSSISGLLDSGLGNDTINLYGNGHGTLQNFANVEAVNLFSGDWTLGSEGASINFQSGLQTLSLGTTVLGDGHFDGTINNFSSGDVLDLTGIGLATSATLGANNVLTISGGSVAPITLQLDPLQDLSGQVFQLTSDGAGGTNITLSPAGGKTVVVAGTNGDDAIVGGAKDDIINGRDGDDDISGGKGDDIIQTGNGSSVLDGGKGDDVLVAGNGDNNVLIGGDGKDFLTVGDGNNNTLSGGDGADTFHVGAGINFLSGGKGGDTFVFGPDFGENTIADFDKHDRIEFNDVFADFQALLDASQQDGGNTVISLGAGHSITLVGVSLDSLHASDFLFT